MGIIKIQSARPNLKYTAIYEDYKARGFECADMERFPFKGNYVDYRTKQIINTPYVLRGMPVKGYVMTGSDPKTYDAETGLHTLFGSNIYVETEPNVLYPVKELGLENEWATNKLTGAMKTMSELQKDCEIVARTAAGYKCVATYDEYKVHIVRGAAIRGEKVPKDDDWYFDYLDAQVGPLTAHPETYVGRVKSPEGLEEMKLTCPSYRKKLQRKLHKTIEVPEDIEDRWVEGDDFEMA